MTTIREGRQTLSFDTSWSVLKWDGSHEFVGSMDAALHQLGGGVKAADVVGVRDIRRQAKLLLIAEFKDFEHPGIPTSRRAAAALAATSGDLMQNIVRKIVDTLSGATFAHDSSQQRCPELDSWRPALGRATTRMLVLVCVEMPESQGLAALPWTKELQRRLRWLGPNTRVIVSTSCRPFRGEGITYQV